MSYEVWVMLLLLLNTALGIVAVYQRHQTIRKLNGEEKLPQVHQPRTWEFPPTTPKGPQFKALLDFLEVEREAGKSNRQDEGAGQGSSGNIGG